MKKVALPKNACMIFLRWNSPVGYFYIKMNSDVCWEEHVVGDLKLDFVDVERCTSTMDGHTLVTMSQKWWSSTWASMIKRSFVYIDGV